MENLIALKQELKVITDEISKLYDKAKPIQSQISKLEEAIQVQELQDISPEKVMSLDYSTLKSEPYNVVQSFMRTFPNLSMMGYSPETLQGAISINVDEKSNVDQVLAQVTQFLPYIKPRPMRGIENFNLKRDDKIKYVNFMTPDCSVNGIVGLVEHKGEYSITLTYRYSLSVLFTGSLEHCLKYVIDRCE